MKRINAAMQAVLPVVLFVITLGVFFLNPGKAFADSDGDGYNVPQDCNDANASIHPDAAEVCNDIDDDCDGEADDGGDGDGDGWSRCGYANPDGLSDCDDENRAIYPGAYETCDGIDNDCDFEADEASDSDGDGYAIDCDGELLSSEDCNDANTSIHPGATETCDGVDNDCDGQIDESGGGSTSRFYRDADTDSFGDPQLFVDACAQPVGYVTNSSDCDDTDPATYPGADEVCDGFDNDCDGNADDGLPTSTRYLDEDGDGYGDPDSPVTACDGARTLLGDGTVTNAEDCDDDDPSVYPGAIEVCDGFDNDCDGTTDEGVSRTVYLDGDGDGYGGEQVQTCESSLPPGYVVAGEDCDDSDPAIHPGAAETCDGTDNDCDGAIDEGLTSCEPDDTASPTPTSTVSPTPDDGPPDSNPDDDARDDPSDNGGGCNCSASPTRPSGLGMFFSLLGAVVWFWTRKRS